MSLGAVTTAVARPSPASQAERAADGPPRRGRELAQLRTRRVGEADMRDEAVAEERGRAAHRAIDELIDQHEVARMELGLEAPDRAGGHEPLHAELLEAPDVRA